MQETKLGDPDFPHAQCAARGYHAQFAGQRTSNGVALLSRVPGTAACCHGCHIDPEPRRAERPSNHIPVVAEFDLPREELCG